MEVKIKKHCKHWCSPSCQANSAFDTTGRCRDSIVDHFRFARLSMVETCWDCPFFSASFLCSQIATHGDFQAQLEEFIAERRSVGGSRSIWCLLKSQFCFLQLFTPKYLGITWDWRGLILETAFFGACIVLSNNGVADVIVTIGPSSMKMMMNGDWWWMVKCFPFWRPLSANKLYWWQSGWHFHASCWTGQVVSMWLCELFS